MSYELAFHRRATSVCSVSRRKGAVCVIDVSAISYIERERKRERERKTDRQRGVPVDTGLILGLESNTPACARCTTSTHAYLHARARVHAARVQVCACLAALARQ